MKLTISIFPTTHIVNSIYFAIKCSLKDDIHFLDYLQVQCRFRVGMGRFPSS